MFSSSGIGKQQCDLTVYKFLNQVLSLSNIAQANFTHEVSLVDEVLVEKMD